MIHGITDADVADAPTIADLLPQLRRLMAGKPVTSYNLAFDSRTLGQSIAAVSLEGPVDWRAPVECLMEMYAEWWGDWSDYHGSYTWQSLGTALDQCGLHVDGQLHRALADAKGALELLRRMARSDR